MEGEYDGLCHRMNARWQSPLHALRLMQKYTKEIDSDALSAQISKGSAAAAKLGASAGIVDRRTGKRLRRSAMAQHSKYIICSLPVWHGTSTP